MSLETCYDAVDVTAIPASATIILAYVDGDYVTLAAVRQRFPRALVLTVTTNGEHDADLGDVESGDLIPETGAVLYRDGRVRALYSDVSTEGELARAVGGAFDWFAADPTGAPHLVKSNTSAVVVGTQYAWPGHGSAGNYDMSLVESSWASPAPNPQPAPVPAPAPTRYLEATMATTDPVSHTVVATNSRGQLFARPGALPAVPTLTQHPNWNAGTATDPCVGVVFEDPRSTGTWGVTFVTEPVSTRGSFGPYNLYHFNRNGTPN